MHKNVKDITGQKFNRLEAIEYIGSRNGNSYWKCRCDCGNITEVCRSHLVNSHTKSCGCYSLERRHELYYKGGQYLTGCEFARIKNNAKTRNLEFKIDINDIEFLYEKQNKKCALSNIDIIFDKAIPNRKFIRGNASVDRIDSAKGYTTDNIQIIDKDVNLAKQSLSQKEFIEMCKRIAKHNE